MSARLVIARGTRFGRLTVRGEAAPVGWARRLRCVCSCGNAVTAHLRNLRAGATTSCGCVAAEKAAARLFKHGESHRTVEYRIWSGAIRRCTSKIDKLYPYYGGRGIRVCRRWMKFVAFIADIERTIGRRPSPQHSLDRKNNNGNYAPGNVRWATRTQQARNTRSNRRIAVDGVTRTLAEWAERSGIPYKTVHARLKAGALPRDAIFQPLRSAA